VLVRDLLVRRSSTGLFLGQGQGQADDIERLREDAGLAGLLSEMTQMG